MHSDIGLSASGPLNDQIISFHFLLKNKTKQMMKNWPAPLSANSDLTHIFFLGKFWTNVWIV